MQPRRTLAGMRKRRCPRHSLEPWDARMGRKHHMYHSSGRGHCGAAGMGAVWGRRRPGHGASAARSRRRVPAEPCSRHVWRRSPRKTWAPSTSARSTGPCTTPAEDDRVRAGAPGAGGKGRARPGGPAEEQIPSRYNLFRFCSPIRGCCVCAQSARAPDGGVQRQHTREAQRHPEPAQHSRGPGASQSGW